MKQRTVVFAPEARDDILAIYDWISARAGPRTALSYIERLETTCLGFSSASERGHRRDDIREGLRITGFEPPVTIAFTVNETQVIILRLFYGGPDWEADKTLTRQKTSAVLMATP